MKKDNQIKEMICPVCGKFYFTKLSSDDIREGILPNDIKCSQCGWIYDLEQYSDENLKNKSNKLSLKEYKAKYNELISINPKYNYLNSICTKKKRHKCPVCGETIFKDVNSLDICKVCGWQDDNYFEGGGANDMTLAEAKKEFFRLRKLNPKYNWFEFIKTNQEK